MECNFEAQIMLASKMLTEIANSFLGEAQVNSARGDNTTAIVLMANVESLRATAGQLAALVVLHRSYAHADEAGHKDTAVPWIKGFLIHANDAFAEYLNSNPHIKD